MRNRNSFKLIILLALVLFLGVGYAVVNSVSLTVTGTAGAATSDLKVVFNGTSTLSNTTKGSASVTNGSKTATFTASNMTLNESITFTYTIVNNESDVSANVTLSATGSNDYFTVASSPSSVVVLPGETAVVKVVVKMIKTPLDSSSSSASFTVTLNAAPVDLITFYTTGTISGTYYAEAGMTWREWALSSYGSPYGFGTTGAEVTYMTTYVTDNYVSVSPNDVIKSGYTYYLIQD